MLWTACATTPTLQHKALDIDDHCKKPVSRQVLTLQDARVDIEQYNDKLDAHCTFSDGRPSLRAELYYDHQQLFMVRCTNVAADDRLHTLGTPVEWLYTPDATADTTLQALITEIDHLTIGWRMMQREYDIPRPMGNTLR